MMTPANALGLLEPKKQVFKAQNGREITYTLSKFDCVIGREIYSKYPMSNLPKLGDYATSEETMFKLMYFVAVDLPNGPIRLHTTELVKNHVPDWELLTSLERAMLAYNYSFFSDGKGHASLAELLTKLAALTTKISTDSLVQFLAAVKQLSTSSDQSTP